LRIGARRHGIKQRRADQRAQGGIIDYGQKRCIGRGADQPAGVAIRGGTCPKVQPPNPTDNLQPGSQIAQSGVFSAALIGVAVVPVALGFFWQMRSLCRHSASGEVLSQRGTRPLRLMGVFASLVGLFSVILPTLQRLAMTWGTGSVMISLAVTEGAIGFLALGGSLLMTGWAMAEATRAAEENAGLI
jgi:hypothetical protein